MTDAKRHAAFHILPALKVGQRVRVTQDGRTSEMYVSVAARRSDGAFGSWESTHVTVTYGPGRYAFEVGAESIASGRHTIEAITD